MKQQEETKDMDQQESKEGELDHFEKGEDILSKIKKLLNKE